MENLCLHCDCSGHHLELNYDDECDQIYVAAEVKPRGFWIALKEAWKLFQGVRKGCYEEVILSRESIDKLYNFLRKIEFNREMRKETK